MENLEKEVKVVRGMKTVTEGAFENADCDYPPRTVWIPPGLPWIKTAMWH